MFREPHRFVRTLIVLLGGLALAACRGDSAASEDPESPADQQPASTKARVKRKAPALLAADLGQALDLPRAELCRELSIDATGAATGAGHDCFEAHGIVLGGVEPYRLRIDEPLVAPSVAATTAVDRIVLSACGERVARDFEDPAGAVLFAELTAAAPGDDARAAVARRLYERLLARPAYRAEIDALVDFHAELAASAQPARDWAQLACYAVATTTEFLFY